MQIGFSEQIGVTEQTCYRWRKEHRGLRMDPAKWAPPTLFPLWRILEVVFAYKCVGRKVPFG